MNEDTEKLTRAYETYEKYRQAPEYFTPDAALANQLMLVIQHEQDRSRNMTDKDLAPANRPLGNYYLAMWQASLLELAKANKGLRRLAEKVRRLRAPCQAPVMSPDQIKSVAKALGLPDKPDASLPYEGDAIRCLVALVALRRTHGGAYFSQSLVAEKAGLPKSAVLFDKNTESGVLRDYGPFGKQGGMVATAGDFPYYALSWRDGLGFEHWLDEQSRKVLGASLESLL